MVLVLLTFWDSFGRFLLLVSSLFLSLSPSAFCIIAPPRRLSSPTAFAICSTTTSAAIHLPGGSFNGYNFALGWNFVSDGGASLFSGKPLIPYFSSFNPA